MSVIDAQKTVVSRTANFLTEQEQQEILRTVTSLELPRYTNSPTDDVDYYGNPIHTTTYLQHNSLFLERLPWLHHKVLKLVQRVNCLHNWGFSLKPRTFSLRVAEYHEMCKGGALSNKYHYDIGSLITVDIMLEEPQRGACFQTLEANGTVIHHPFCRGDALIFVSHKYHNVSPLERGRRKVLVLEFWNGVVPVCGHRCDLHFGQCHFVDNTC